MPLIREARRGDELAVVSVIQPIYDDYGFSWDPEGYHADLYDLERFYWESGDAIYLAELETEPVGTVAFELFEPGSVGASGLARIEGCDCSIERLYVASMARRKGVGRALFEHVVEELRQRGRQRMEIWSDKRFTEAHLLYERCGATIVGDRICDDPDESPEWGLVLDLTVK